MTMREVEVTPRSPERLVPLLRPDRARALEAMIGTSREVFAGRTIWNVSSTAAGGGVAEMLHGLVRYVRGAGVDCRWVVIEGTPAFFDVTKRIHNRIHGERGDDGDLGDEARAVYQRVVDENADRLLPLVGADDVVILHDPQPLGLVDQLKERGTKVVWRCHVGTEHFDRWTEEAWGFLRGWAETADAVVLSRAVYAPPWLDPARAHVIAPAIDPLSAKNQPLDGATVLAILGRAGIVDHPPDGAAFLDGEDQHRDVTVEARVQRAGGPLGPDVPVLTQVSRWDRLKDMGGVLRAFVDGRVAGQTGAHLLLVGPDVTGVTDDPEGSRVLEECIDAWKALSPGDRATVSLVTLPMAALDENAAVVNALQRHATVVAQKSLHEGFGLTVSEAMWKGRPVVGSAVGGIQDQVRDGTDGLLVADPTDLGAFAAAVRTLLGDLDRARSMGEAAHERVRDTYLADRDLRQWMELLGQLGIG